MSYGEIVPVLAIEDASLHREALACLKQAYEFGDLQFQWYRKKTPKRISKPLDYQKYVKFLSGNKVDAWGRLPNKALVFIDLKLGVISDLLTPDQLGELKEWLGEEYGVGENREGGLYLAGCAAIKNHDWSGTIMIASSGGAGTPDVQVPLRRIAERAVGKVIIRDAAGTLRSRRWDMAFEAGVRAYKEQFGDRIGIFLEKMSDLTIEKCHTGWGRSHPPEQLSNLASFLAMSEKNLARRVGMSTDPYPGDQGTGDSTHCVAECLKTLGTGNSHNFSPLGALFIGWGAHRSLFPDEPSDSKFAKAVSDWVKAERFPGKGRITRSGSICARQASEEQGGKVTRDEVIRAFYEMVRRLFKADRPSDFGAEPKFAEGDDLLLGVGIHENGLWFHLNLSPKDLAKSLYDAGSVYNSRTDKTFGEDTKIESSPTGGETTSKQLLNFWALSALSSLVIPSTEPKPFLGADYPMSLRNASDHHKYGTLLCFGEPE